MGRGKKNKKPKASGTGAGDDGTRTGAYAQAAPAPAPEPRKGAELKQARALDQDLNNAGPRVQVQSSVASRSRAGVTPSAIVLEEKHQDQAAPAWSASSWLMSIQLLDILSTELIKKGEDKETQAETVKKMSGEEVGRAFDASVATLRSSLLDAHYQLQEQEHVDAAVLNEKFAADGNGFTYTYGGMDTYHAGLEGLIGLPSPDIEKKMEWEHTQSWYAQCGFSCWYLHHPTTSRSEYDYVSSAAVEARCNNGLRDAGHGGWTLKTIMRENKELITKAGLVLAEVMALRLYTGPMFLWYNNVLRFCRAKLEDIPGHLFHIVEWKKSHGSEEYPFVTTLHVLNSAILKLSKVQPAEKVYRGAKGGILPQQFWVPNEDNIRGGIELGFMSTTKAREVAVHYASGDSSKPSMVFEIQMGMIDRGASIRWCSQFPAEEEIVFAPLTGLEVVGTPHVDGRTLVVQLRLNCNLHDLTIEQVTAKMKKTHTDLVNTITQDMLMSGFTPESLDPLQRHMELHEKKEGRWFNNADNYKQATNAALEAKLVVCAEVLKKKSVAGHKDDKEMQLAAAILFKSDAEKAIRTLLSDAALLEMYGEDLDEIADDAELVRLDLQDQGLGGELPKPILKLLGTADYFNLHGNTFTNIKAGTALYEMVYGMTNWRDRQELHWSEHMMDGAQFHSLPEAIGTFRQVGLMDLSRNFQLASLPDAVGDMESLQTLNLAHCAIRRLPETMEKLQKLQKLDLDQCIYLESMPAAMSRLTSLTWLNINHCIKLQDDSASVIPFESLKDLHSCNTSICVWSLRAVTMRGRGGDMHHPHDTLRLEDDTSCPAVQEATRMDFSHMKMPTLPESFALLQKLEWLNFDSCIKLTQLPASVAALSSLTMLSLNNCHAFGNNALALICDNFIQTDNNLREFYIDKTNVSVYPLSLGVLCAKDGFRFGANQRCSTLSSDASNVRGAKRLCFKDMKINELPDSVAELEQLEWLDMRSCDRLARLPARLPATLQYVNIEHCRLLGNGALHTICSSCPQLKELYVDNTNITRYPMTVAMLKGNGMRFGRNNLPAEIEDDASAVLGAETLDFSGLGSVTKIPDAIGHLQLLKTARFDGLFALTEFPSLKQELPNVESVNFDGCQQLGEEAMVAICRSFPNLKDLHTNETNIYRFPLVVGKMKANGCRVHHVWLCRELDDDISSMQDIERLDFAHFQRITSLPESVGRLEKVTWLNLDNCWSLASLPVSLAGMKSLEWLNLNGCKRLGDDAMEFVCTSFPNLKELHTNDTSIRRFPLVVGRMKANGCRFHQQWMCTSLGDDVRSVQDATNLDFSEMSFDQLPDTIGTLNFERLNLKSCWRLSTLPPSLAGVKTLNWLNVEGCRALDASSTKSLAHVSNLYDDSTRMTPLVVKLADVQDSDRLDYKHQTFVELPDVFGELSKLSWLSLDDCQWLRTLPSSLAGMTSLKFMNCNGCRSLGNDALDLICRSLPDLDELHVNHTGITSYPLVIGAFKERGMRFTANHFLPGKLDDDVFAVRDAEKLDFSGMNMISKIPASFGQLKKLKWLNTEKCTLLTAVLIDSEMESLEWWNANRCLSLGKKAMVAICRSCPNLKELHTNETNIYRFPLVVGRMKANGCRFHQQWFCRELDDDISSMQDIERLDFAHFQRITSLPESVGRLEKVTWLNLDNCWSLASLPVSLAGMKSLEWLNLNGCKRLGDDAMEFVCTSFPNLKELHTNDTSIRRFPLVVGRMKANGCRFHQQWMCTSLGDDVRSVRDVENLDFSGLICLTSLPPSFGELQRVSRLNFHSCHSLCNGLDALGKLRTLKQVYLEGCRRFHNNALAAVCQSNELEELHINDTAVTRYPLALFAMRARGLDFRPNMTLEGELDEDTSAVREATALDMSHMHFIRVLPECIGGLNRLKSLNLDQCIQLASIPRTISSLPELTELNISGCRQLGSDTVTLILSSLPPKLKNFHMTECVAPCPLAAVGSRKAKGLHVSISVNAQGRTEVFCENTSEIQDVEELDLEHFQNLEELPNGVGEMKKLQSLNLHNCQRLRSLPVSLASTSLTFLNLNKCLHIGNDTLSFIYKHLRRTLKHLHIDNTSVTCYPLALFAWRAGSLHGAETTLECFSPNNRLLGEIDEVTGDVQDATKFDFSGMHAIKKLPTSLAQLKITWLDLEGCLRLENLPESMPKLAELQWLNTSHCKELGNADADFLYSASNFPALTEIHMHGTAVTWSKEDKKKRKDTNPSCDMHGI